MKKIVFARRTPVVVLALSASLFVTACPSPDLVIRSMGVSGQRTINEDNSVEAPLQVVVENIGEGSAGIFKVAVSYTETGTGGGGVVAFTVPGQVNTWYPFTSGLLAPGATETFNGVLTFLPSLHGINVDLVSHADSSSGDEFMPMYCRVRESDETNNDSATITLALP